MQQNFVKLFQIYNEGNTIKYFNIQDKMIFKTFWTTFWTFITMRLVTVMQYHKWSERDWRWDWCNRQML